MDDKGLIFTTDAVLALVIFMVFASAMVTYYAMPNYAGQDQESLQRIAGDALRIMEYDGTIYTAASLYQSGNQTGANDILTERLDQLIPNNTAYKMTVDDYDSAENDRGVLVSSNIATRVQVLSAPQEGWMGRAWYKLEKAEFEDQQNNVTTTVWNFHNWLTNFDPWDNDGQLYSYPYWGKGSTAQNIAFSIPSDAQIKNAYFLIGSSAANNLSSYGATTFINNVNQYRAEPNQFTFLNYRPGETTRMYNFQGNISASNLTAGLNNYYVRFTNITNANKNRYNLAWFAVIANYTTNFKVPKGVINERYDFIDAAGLAVPNAQNLGSGNAYGRIYDLKTGTVTSLNTQRIMNWNTFSSNRNTLDSFDDGVPFVMTNVNGESGSAVSVMREFDLPNDTISILDGALYLNAYGGVDNAMVEVWDGDEWECVFCSFDFKSTPSASAATDYSAVGDGYGNIPGIIYIGNKLRAGHNKVRITAWDQVPSSDYDLAGLVDCYLTSSYTRLPIKWNNFPFYSYQDSDNSYSQQRSFTTEAGAREVYLFAGAGTDTKNFKVDIKKGATWVNVYNSNVIPYAINLASLDANTTKNFTTGTGLNYTVIPGTYTIRVNVTGPSNFWESGDTSGNAEIYSGSRVAVLYPEFLENIWTASYAQDPDTARANAIAKLNQTLSQAGYTINPNLFKSEALFTGDLPNNIPVRLDLWRG